MNFARIGDIENLSFKLDENKIYALVGQKFSMLGIAINPQSALIIRAQIMIMDIAI